MELPRKNTKSAKLCELDIENIGFKWEISVLYLLIKIQHYLTAPLLVIILFITVSVTISPLGMHSIDISLTLKQIHVHVTSKLYEWK